MDGGERIDGCWCTVEGCCCHASMCCLVLLVAVAVYLNGLLGRLEAETNVVVVTWELVLLVQVALGADEHGGLLLERLLGLSRQIGGVPCAMVAVMQFGGDGQPVVFLQ